MNVQIVFQQMSVIVALVCLGIWMYRKNISVMSLFGVEAIMLQAFVLMLAMPVANMPLMLAKKNGEDTGVLTQEILMKTFFTPVTLTMVSFVLCSYF